MKASDDIVRPWVPRELWGRVLLWLSLLVVLVEWFVAWLWQGGFFEELDDMNPPVRQAPWIEYALLVVLAIFVMGSLLGVRYVTPRLALWLGVGWFVIRAVTLVEQSDGFLAGFMQPSPLSWLGLMLLDMAVAPSAFLGWGFLALSLKRFRMRDDQAGAVTRG